MVYRSSKKMIRTCFGRRRLENKPKEGVKEKKRGRIGDLRDLGLIRWGIGGRCE